MFRLFLIIYTLAGATLAGSAAIAGFLVAVPVAWIVAKNLSAA